MILYVQEQKKLREDFLMAPSGTLDSLFMMGGSPIKLGDSINENRLVRNPLTEDHISINSGMKSPPNRQE
ncbi:hypothetical protein KIN20_035844 [Parelaphostrongylus tenuis]|uniref:Uncharacterized protein n=1 Tax=Parelaphostrongylus tenuis TaxID=148309 RepID=A0AAD5WKT1_PARTN|nr:hypothetical protein KIN20_035844 [Parelaphostrongylus tenuis]